MKKLQKLLAVAALPLALAACGGGSEGPTTQPDDLAAACADATDAEATIALLPGLLFNLPVWVAEDQGMFESNNVDAEILMVQGGGAQAVAALLGGSADLTYASVQQVALANVEGQPLRLVVGNHTAQPYALLVSNDLEDPAEGTPFPEVIQALEGKTIAVTSLGSDSHIKMLEMIEAAGMSEDDVTIMQAGTTPVPSFVSGAFDAILHVEPVISQLTVEMEAAHIAMDLRSSDGNAPEELRRLVYNGWIATESGASTCGVYNASAAIADAIEFIQDPGNRDELHEIASANLEGQSPEVITNQLESAANGFNVVFDRVETEFTLSTFDMEETPSYDDLITGLAKDDS